MPGRSCGFCARLFNGICHRIGNGDYNCFFSTLDFIFRKVLGKILVFFVYAILTFLTFVVCTIVIPYESLFQPLWCLTLLVIFATYLMTNIIYHYYKASTTHPGNPPKSSQLPLCRHCQNHKPPGVHHCAICNQCIVKMDHHCIWVNQCVGAKNHRHFLQFLAFLVTGCATFTVGGFNTFYHNYWRPTSNQVFCNSDLVDLPWFDWFCGGNSEFIISSVFFSYFLCALVFLLVGGLFWWNFVLVSAGTTYIGILAALRQLITQITDHVTGSTLGLILSEERFNDSLAKTRVFVENTIRRWKRRYHSLHGELRNDISKIPKLIVEAACVWNECVNINYDVERDDREEDQTVGNHDDGSMEPSGNISENTGAAQRNSIYQEYFS